MAEVQFGLESIMRPAPELDVADCSLSTHTVGHDVVKLQEGPLCASPPIVGYEAATAAVSVPDLSPDFGRNVT